MAEQEIILNSNVGAADAGNKVVRNAGTVLCSTPLNFFMNNKAAISLLAAVRSSGNTSLIDLLSSMTDGNNKNRLMINPAVAATPENRVDSYGSNLTGVTVYTVPTGKVFFLTYASVFNAAGDCIIGINGGGGTNHYLTGAESATSYYRGTPYMYVPFPAGTTFVVAGTGGIVHQLFGWLEDV